MAEWIGIGVTLFFSLLAVVKSYGYDKRRMEDLENKVRQHDRLHAKHFEHTVDQNAHFTPRERDELTKKLDLILDELIEMRKRKWGDSE